MAGVAQLVERQVVVLDAVGSSPIARPKLRSHCASAIDFAEWISVCSLRRIVSIETEALA